MATAVGPNGIGFHLTHSLYGGGNGNGLTVPHPITVTNPGAPTIGAIPRNVNPGGPAVLSGSGLSPMTFTSVPWQNVTRRPRL